MNRPRPGAWLAALGAAALVTAAATWALGWWGVPLTAALVTVLWRTTPRVIWAATAGAVIAWGALLAMDATGTGMRMLSMQLAGTMGVPLPGLVAATLIFPAILAWSAAALTASIVDASS